MWIAALAGLGTRVQMLPADPALAGRLPALPEATAERIGGIEQYGEIAARPLFSEDRRPRPFLLGGNSEGATSAVRLTGVLMTPGVDMATLTTEHGQSIRLRLGGPPEAGWQLLALEPRSATVSGPGGTQVLELQVFNGQGGIAPTPLASNDAATAAAAAAATGTGVNGALAPTPPPVVIRNTTPPLPAAHPVPAPAPAADAAADTPTSPSPQQMQAIRDRIQARRRQLQQQQQAPNRNASPTGPNK
ncbi:general secretion pathway protein GspN [Stenotrophomonas sp. Marseille-Q4652]|uniref:general secretion pathway protein GspN n=1 Tax=Stenotrophomonas sp. Marseille-Q4652 TaxID=2866595 RepID=UPI001CE408AE|nr:general secretion pathway protein GspN [Stenotrophomonas sp. Marseille-Q4652]